MVVVATLEAVVDSGVNNRLRSNKVKVLADFRITKEDSKEEWDKAADGEGSELDLLMFERMKQL